MGNKTVYVPVNPEGFGCGILIGLIMRFWRQILIVAIVVVGCFCFLGILQSLLGARTSAIAATQSSFSATQVESSVSRLQKLLGHTKEVRAVAFSHDGQMLASASKDNTIRLWQRINDKWQSAIITQTTDPNNTFSGISFTPDDRMIAASGSSGTQLLDQVSGNQSLTFGVATIFFAPGPNYIGGANGNSVMLWDLASGSLQNSFKVDTYAIVSTSITPNGKQIAVGCFEGKVYIVDSDSGAQNKLPFGPSDYQIHSVSFSPDGTLLAEGDEHGIVGVWNLRDGHEVGYYGQGEVATVAFSPDGRWVISGGGEEVVIWDIASSKQIKTQYLKTSIDSIAISPDGTTIAIAGGDGIIYLWTVQ